MRNLLGILFVVAFVASLFIIGGVESGTGDTLMWWMIPTLAVMGGAVFAAEHKK